MKESIYRTYEELPLLLNAEVVVKVLGIALSAPMNSCAKLIFQTAPSPISAWPPPSVMKLASTGVTSVKIDTEGKNTKAIAECIKHQ